MAPVNPVFASINLAQAVLIIGYEWRKLMAGASLGRGTQFDGPASEGLYLNKCNPATRGELLNFFAHIEAELTEAGFFKTDEKRAKHDTEHPQYVREGLIDRSGGEDFARHGRCVNRTAAHAPQGGVAGQQCHELCRVYGIAIAST